MISCTLSQQTSIVVQHHNNRFDYEILVNCNWILDKMYELISMRRVKVSLSGSKEGKHVNKGA